MYASVVCNSLLTHESTQQFGNINELVARQLKGIRQLSGGIDAIAGLS
jgi:hypothetical protein